MSEEFTFPLCLLSLKGKLKVVVDPCGGTASPYVKDFLEGMGLKVKCINCMIKKGFPRNPEPLPENLGKLSETVRSHGADLGLAQDADADRLATVDEQGVPLSEEYTLALTVQYYLEERAKSPVVNNLSTSKVIEDIAHRAGVQLYRVKVGEVNVVKGMLEKGAAIGGEGNGGIIIPEIHACRDSFAGKAIILEYLVKSREKLSRLKKNLPQYFMVKEKVGVSFREGRLILSKLEGEFSGGKRDFRDGLRVEFPDYWFHVRPSNTEPVLRIIVEARDKEQALKIINRIKEIL